MCPRLELSHLTDVKVKIDLIGMPGQQCLLVRPSCSGRPACLGNPWSPGSSVCWSEVTHAWRLRRDGQAEENLSRGHLDFSVDRAVELSSIQSKEISIGWL